MLEVRMRTIHRVFLVVSLALVTAFAQDQDSLSAVRQALAAKYTLTKTTADKSGVVSSGSVLVLKKDNLVTGDANGTLVLANTYKGGKITQGLLGHMASGTTGTRTFVAGEKLWVTNIDVNNKGVVFTLFSDSYPDLHYKATLTFPFAKGAAPSPADALGAIDEVFQTDGFGHETASGSAVSGQTASSSDQNAGSSVASAQVADNTPWNSKYGRLTREDLQRINQASVRFDVNYFRLNPSALNQKPVMQYFIALNNCNNPEIGRALANELDYPALAEYYKSKAPQILNALPRTVPDVALYRFIGGGQADGWRLWSKSLTLGEYNVQRKAFPMKYPGKDEVDIPDSLTTEGSGRDLSKACPVASRPAAAASKYLPGVYAIALQPAVYKELPMDEDAARKYIDSAGQQRNVFLAVDVNIQDTPPAISNPNNSSMQATFRVQTARIRVIDGKTLKSLGTLYDDHSVTDAVQATQQAPPPPPDTPKRGSQWAASDHLYDIRRAVYVWLAADACPDWPISAEQSANLKNFLQSAQNGKFNEKEQYSTTNTVVRNAIAREGRANYCANPMERRDYEKALLEIAPSGPIAAPVAK
jgi:hypothetical protein